MNDSVKTAQGSETSRTTNQFIKSIPSMQSNHELTNDNIFQIVSFYFVTFSV